MPSDEVGIKAIASHLGELRIDNLARADEFGKSPDFIKDKIGFVYLARKLPHQDTSDLCVAAFENLAGKAEIDPRSIDCLVVCTQNPDDKGLPHTAALVHEKLELPQHVAAFDVSLGCSGYVYGLAIAKSFMTAQGLESGLLFTADPYSKVLDPRDPNTELLFGDGATATWLGKQPAYDIGKGLFGTDGSGWRALAVQPDTGQLTMSGREVFMFTMKVVPQQIRECLRLNNLDAGDIDLFLLHQGSRFIVENMTKALALPPDRVPFAAADIGNTVSSSVPLMLEQHMTPVRNKILISGFGVGLSWATSILSRHDATQ
jgi:3-oxoacyl-[acyl-carrier-protein] synthase-3